MHALGDLTLRGQVLRVHVLDLRDGTVRLHGVQEGRGEVIEQIAEWARLHHKTAVGLSVVALLYALVGIAMLWMIRTAQEGE